MAPLRHEALSSGDERDVNTTDYDGSVDSDTSTVSSSSGDEDGISSLQVTESRLIPVHLARYGGPRTFEAELQRIKLLQEMNNELVEEVEKQHAFNNPLKLAVLAELYDDMAWFGNRLLRMARERHVADTQGLFNNAVEDQESGYDLEVQDGLSSSRMLPPGVRRLDVFHAIRVNIYEDEDTDYEEEDLYGVSDAEESGTNESDSDNESTLYLADDEGGLDGEDDDGLDGRPIAAVHAISNATPGSDEATDIDDCTRLTRIAEAEAEAGPTKDEQDEELQAHNQQAVESLNHAFRSLSLAYTQDALDVREPRIVQEPAEDKSSEPQSRRVLIQNLPPCVSNHQVFTCTQGFGRVIEGRQFFGIGKHLTKEAQFEFESVESAKQFVLSARDNSPVFVNKDEKSFTGCVQLIPTDSYTSHPDSNEPTQAGNERVLTFKAFPRAWIWFLLDKYGLSNIVHAAFAPSEESTLDGDLTIEFTSAFQASRILDNIARGVYRFYGRARRQDVVPCAVRPWETAQNTNGPSNVFRHSPSDLLEKEFNVRPYNLYQYNQVMPTTQPQSGLPREESPGAPPPTYREYLSEELNLQDTNADSIYNRATATRDVEYKIIGSSITLTRRPFGWSLPLEDEIALLMTHTLHDPDWTLYWDDYFVSSGMPNLRKYDQYGRLARHRRQLSVSQGLEPSTVPRCTGTDCFCQPLDASSTPGFVKAYTSSNTREFVGTNGPSA